MKKPNVSIIYTLSDGTPKVFPVISSESYGDGTRWTFKFDNIEQYLFTLDSYKPLFVNGREYIAGVEGCLAATTFHGQKLNAPGEEMAFLMRKGFGAKYTKTLIGDSSINFKMILVILAIIVVIGVGYFAYQSSQPKSVPQVSVTKPK